MTTDGNRSPHLKYKSHIISHSMQVLHSFHTMIVDNFIASILEQINIVLINCLLYLRKTINCQTTTLGTLVFVAILNQCVFNVSTIN